MMMMMMINKYILGLPCSLDSRKSYYRKSSIKPPSQISPLSLHGSYNLEKVLKFTSRLEKSLSSIKVLEKYLFSLLGLEKSLKFATFCQLPFSVK